VTVEWIVDESPDGAMAVSVQVDGELSPREPLVEATDRLWAASARPFDRLGGGDRSCG
jgi:hypothetical protein